MTIFIVVLALAGRANALQLTSHVNTLSTPKSLRIIEKVHAITSEHIYLGDTNVKMQRPNGLHLEPGLIEGDGKIFWTVDSGATAICIPVEDEWMLDRVTDAHPNIGVEAADGIQLAVKTVGVINADGLLPGKIGIETYEIKGGRWVKNEEPSYPTMSRVLVTQGLKRGTGPGESMLINFAYSLRIARYSVRTLWCVAQIVLRRRIGEQVYLAR